MLISRPMQRGALLLLCAPLFSTPLQAQAPANGAPTQGGAVLEFHLERPGLPVPSYAFVVHEDGSGAYTATYVDEPSSASSTRLGAVQPGVPRQTSHPLALSSKTSAKLFSLARGTHEFRTPCASKAKNIANTGAKTLSYAGADGTGSCTFNYTEVKAVAELTTIFQGMALTLDSARKLDLKHRFDRLGLDEEMNSLTESVRGGRALEMSNIASSLQALVDDTAVLERVRTEAAALLEQGSAKH